MSKTDTDLVYEEIFVEDVYRQHGVKLRDGDCIIDIGANTGLFEVFLNQICRGATIYACEPIPATFEVLSANLRGLDQIKPIALNVGVGGRRRTEKFSFFPRLSCASTMYPDLSSEEEQRGLDYTLAQFREHPNRLLRTLLAMLPSPVRRRLAERVRRFYTQCVEVECTLLTLEDLVSEHSIEQIDFLKLDAERSEREILFSIDQNLWPKIRQLVVEVHEGKEACQEVDELLARQGFEVSVDSNPHFPNIFMLYGTRPADGVVG